MGLCNAPAIFQQTMQSALLGLTRNQVLVYLDGVIVLGNDRNQQSACYCLKYRQVALYTSLCEALTYPRSTVSPDQLLRPKEWVKNLPFVVFGILSKVFSKGRNCAARILTFDQIVLKTNSPYPTGTPLEIVRIIEEVSRLEVFSLKEVKRTNQINTARVYGH